jgi:hypothetical protein
MRLFPPHFVRPALSQYTRRHTATHGKITYVQQRALCAPLRSYCSRPLLGFDDDMGKDDKPGKNFNLKVPKGTRDCMLKSPCARQIVSCINR